MSRPAKFDPIVQQAIIGAIRGAATRRQAAGAAAVSERTLYGWLRKGRAGEEPYLQFLQALQKAEAETAIAFVATIVEASKKHWQASAWWLERRYPQDWGTQRREIRELRKQLATLEGLVPSSRTCAARPV